MTNVSTEGVARLASWPAINRRLVDDLNFDNRVSNGVALENDDGQEVDAAPPAAGRGR